MKIKSSGIGLGRGDKEGALCQSDGGFKFYSFHRDDDWCVSGHENPNDSFEANKTSADKVLGTNQDRLLNNGQTRH